MSQIMLNSERRVSPFIAFCKAKRDEVAAANPRANFGRVGSLLTALWKEMSDSEKAVYSIPHSYNKNASKSGLRRSSRLRNKELGVNFFGVKLNHKQ